MDEADIHRQMTPVHGAPEGSAMETTPKPAAQFRFDVAAGTVLGRDHTASGKNNQDAFCCCQEKNWLAAVVCDGCGSGTHSEVGAKLGARLILEALRRRAAELDAGDPEVLLEAVRWDVLKQLEPIIAGMAGTRVEIVNSYFLFTIVGAAIGKSRALVFALGDGVAVLNERPLSLGSTDNRPPYLAYALIPTPSPTSRPRSFTSACSRRCRPRKWTRSCWVRTARRRSAAPPHPPRPDARRSECSTSSGWTIDTSTTRRTWPAA